jgi:RNA polymerase sigma-70 factor (sigma-E family)
VTSDDEEFRLFVAARLDSLRGLAFLTCGDWQLAEDAVSTSLVKVYARWHRVEAPERYAARVVVRAALDEVRRPWRRERSASHELPDAAQPDRSEAITESMRIRQALRQLPAAQRAVLALRFYADFTVEETAQALGRSAGTVTSQTARGLAAMRRLLDEPDPGSKKPDTAQPDTAKEDSDARYAGNPGTR